MVKLVMYCLFMDEESELCAMTLPLHHKGEIN